MSPVTRNRALIVRDIVTTLRADFGQTSQGQERVIDGLVESHQVQGIERPVISVYEIQPQPNPDPNLFGGAYEETVEVAIKAWVDVVQDPSGLDTSASRLALIELEERIIGRLFADRRRSGCAHSTFKRQGTITDSAIMLRGSQGTQRLAGLFFTVACQYYPEVGGVDPLIPGDSSMPVVVDATASVTASAGNIYILTNLGARSVTFPAGSDGDRIVVKEGANSASPITITTTGADEFEDETATFESTSPLATYSFIFQGGAWFVF